MIMAVAARPSPARAWIFRGISLLSLASALATGGCGLFRHKPRTAILPVPNVAVSVAQFTGTALSGPVVDSNAAARLAAPNAARVVRVTFFALDSQPTETLPTVAARARLIYADRGGLPVKPSAELLQSAAVFDLQDMNDLWRQAPTASAARVTPLGTLSGVIADGTHAVFNVSEPARADAITGQQVRRGIDVYLTRTAPNAAASLQLALALTDRSTEPGTTQFQKEVALIDWGPASAALGGTNANSTFGVIVPFQFEGSAAKALAAVCEISSVTSSQADQDLLKSVALQLGRGKPVDQPGAPGQAASSYSVALAATADKIRRRDAIDFLSASTDAVVCQDVSLESDGLTLEQLGNSIRAALPNGTADRSPAQLGWTLDEVALRMLHEKLAGASLTPELSAVLVRHSGEVGRSAASLEAVLKGVRGRDEFNARLMAENRIYLEDNSPASRVRAFDWLAERKVAPPGFDPLAPAKQRRAALENIAAPATVPTTAPLSIGSPVQPAAPVGGLP